MLVALHGGTYTSQYFAVAGGPLGSFLEVAAATPSPGKRHRFTSPSAPVASSRTSPNTWSHSSRRPDSSMLMTSVLATDSVSESGH